MPNTATQQITRTSRFIASRDLKAQKTRKKTKIPEPFTAPVLELLQQIRARTLPGESFHSAYSTVTPMATTKTGVLALAVLTFAQRGADAAPVWRSGLRAHTFPVSPDQKSWLPAASPTSPSPVMASQHGEARLNTPVSAEFTEATVSSSIGRTGGVSPALRLRSKRAVDSGPRTVVISLSTHAPSREKHAERLLLEGGMNPWQKIDVRDGYPTGSEVPGDSHHDTTMTLLELGLEDDKVAHVLAITRTHRVRKTCDNAQRAL